MTAKKNKARGRLHPSQISKSGVLQHILPMRPDEWVEERLNRQAVVRDQYFRDKRRMHVKERQARAVIKAQMARKKNEIDAHYRVGSLKKSDPRLEKVKRKAKHNFEKYERKTTGKNHDQWVKSHRALRTRRDKQYRQITKELKKEIRKSRGVEGKLQTPWNI